MPVGQMQAHFSPTRYRRARRSVANTEREGYLPQRLPLSPQTFDQFPTLPMLSDSCAQLAALAAAMDRRAAVWAEPSPAAVRAALRAIPPWHTCALLLQHAAALLASRRPHRLPGSPPGSHRVTLGYPTAGAPTAMVRVSPVGPVWNRTGWKTAQTRAFPRGPRCRRLGPSAADARSLSPSSGPPICP
jgi:hypothetical protein